VAFALFHLPFVQRVDWLSGTAARAVVALGIGMLLSGIHHFVYVDHYVRVMPDWMPAQQAVVYLSAALRVAFGLATLFPGSRRAATIGSLVLLCVVAPVNIRIAATGISQGQLVDADWFRWLRVVLHASWIGWCGWCLSTLKP
jgi:uncharacterized membrane protein